MRDDWRITATVTNPERLALLEPYFPGGVVPIKSMLPSLAKLPGFLGEARVYDIDLSKISTEQRRGLIETIAAKFDLEPAYVEANFDEQGVPILADDCLITCADQGLFFSMLPDFDV